MRALIVLSCLLFFGTPASAESFYRGFGGQVNDGGADMDAVASDTAGNSYGAGVFNGASLVIGAVTLKAVGTRDAFVAKFDAAGNPVWARSIAGPGATVWANGVRVDGSGNVYVVGFFRGAPLTTPPVARFDYETGFAIKFDSAGSVVWARAYGGTAGSSVQLWGVAVQPSGIAYLTGTFFGNLQAPSLLTGSSGGILIKLDAAGAVVWTRTFTGTANAYASPRAVAVDGTGDAYVGGDFTGSNLTAPALTKIGESDGFAIKVDSSGNVVWARNVGGPASRVTATGIAVDASGNAYLTGYFQDGNLTTPALGRIGFSDGFVMKLDVNGTISWSRGTGGVGTSAFASGVGVGSSGSVYLSGYFHGGDLATPSVVRVGSVDSFFVELNTDGLITASRGIGGSGARISILGLAIDSAQGIYLAGSFYLGQVGSLTPFGAADGFVMKVDSSGTEAWSRGIGATMPGEADLYGMVRDASGNLYVSGRFHVDDFALGNVTLARTGYYDGFAAKLDPSGNVIWAQGFRGPGAKVSARSIAVDPHGYTYVVGSFSDGDLSSPPLTRIGLGDIFVVKLDPSGSIVWARNFGGAGSFPSSHAIAVDADGNVAVGGNMSGSLSTPTLAALGSYDAIAIKLDGAGTVLWARQFGGTGTYTSGEALGADQSGNLYLAGTVRDSSRTNPALAAYGYEAAFVYKIDPGGGLTWTRYFGGPDGSTSGDALFVHAAGDRISVAGHTNSPVLTNPPLSLLGRTDGFIAQLDAGGTTLTARNFGGGSAEVYPKALAADDNGSVYLAAHYVGNLAFPALARIGAVQGWTADSFALRLAPNGTVTWAQRFGVPSGTEHSGVVGGGAEVNAIAADPSGRVTVGGTFYGGDLMAPPLARRGAADAFVATMSPDATRLSNLSTRMQVLTGNDVMIAGFIVGGTQAKTYVVNVAGPSLSNFGISNPLANPTLTLVRSSDQSIVKTNDDWQTQVADDVRAINASGFKPNDAHEPAIIAALAPGAYTAIVQGTGGTTGVGVVGVFEVDGIDASLINISTRGQVKTGNDVMIAGFTVQGSAAQKVVINVAGPSLGSFGIDNALQNPTLTLVRSSDQTVIATNDDWQVQANPGDVAAIDASGFKPNHASEPALIATLQPGAYTAIVQGAGGGTGVGLVGVFTTP